MDCPIFEIFKEVTRSSQGHVRLLITLSRTVAPEKQGKCDERLHFQLDKPRVIFPRYCSPLHAKNISPSPAPSPVPTHSLLVFLFCILSTSTPSLPFQPWIPYPQRNSLWFISSTYHHSFLCESFEIPLDMLQSPSEQ